MLVASSSVYQRCILGETLQSDVSWRWPRGVKVGTVLPTPLPVRPETVPAEGCELLPLVQIIELKWLLAGRGIDVHVERLQNDPIYARHKLAEAMAAGHPALRLAAARLLALLDGPA
jgi:hypothetical protein